MSPKERVRANIYKSLLEEEKRRNKRMSMFSVGLFFVGVVTMSTYNSLVKSISNNNSPYNSTIMLSKDSEDALLTSMYDNNSIINKKMIDLNPDELFTLDTQI
ncbi:MAG: hypothetical protein Q4A58_05480 [Fusobacterium sp.]|uniref:hypothetical protein n=1 Tax=Fusobacterium sp. TaxID=68766 RepID=UPI0026DCA3DA|nr:hypothetical protein [Fusobacterium sp.]MDO4690731.1 hypothetical protein [Fusobacterium sp.]